MALLKQSTAYNRAFLMIDSTDHITGKTGLTVTVTLSKNAAAFAAAGGTITEISSGWYKIALTTTDTNTLGDLAFHCTATGADATDFLDQVVSFDTQDAAGLGLSRIDAAITSRLAPTVAARTLDVSAGGEAGVDWANVGSPTTTLNLSGTSTKAVEPTVAGRTLDVSATGEAGLDWANIGAPTTVQGLSGTTILAATTATNLTNAPTNGDLTATQKASVTTACTASTPTAAAVTGNVGGIGTGGIVNTSFSAGAIDSAAIAASAIAASEFDQTAADKVWSTAARTLTANNVSVKKNSALSGFQFFMVDSADHFTPKTGLTITAVRSINGAAFGACTNAATEIANGWYTIDLSAADLDGNTIALKLTATGADQANILLVTNV